MLSVTYHPFLYIFICTATNWTVTSGMLAIRTRSFSNFVRCLVWLARESGLEDDARDDGVARRYDKDDESKTIIG